MTFLLFNNCQYFYKTFVCYFLRALLFQCFSWTIMCFLYVSCSLRDYHVFSVHHVTLLKVILIFNRQLAFTVRITIAYNCCNVQFLLIIVWIWLGCKGTIPKLTMEMSIGSKRQQPKPKKHTRHREPHQQAGFS